jgi:hypothetical protein
MNINKSNLFWGVLLIGGGLLALAQQLGYTDQFPPLVWVLIFAGVSLVALISYGLSGWREWGWLFPAGIFGGLAATIWLATSEIGGFAVAAPLFIGLTIPFAAAYLTDRARHWWALIPGGVMLFLTLTLLLTDMAGGEIVGALFLFMIAAAFLAVYLNQRSRLWALIVAYVMAVLGVAPLMAMGGETAAYFGPIFLLAVALPFLVVYFRTPERWWAIIPAGAVTSVAVVAALAIANFIQSETQAAYANAVLMGGLAATFAVIWLRHAKAWAQIVTLALAALAVASLFFVSYSQVFWPIAIVLVGAYLIFISLRPKAA